MRLSVFDHADNFLFDLSPEDVFECKRIDEINGEHALSITTTTPLDQSQRIVTKDATGRWREYVVSGVDETHSNGRSAIGTYHCVWSVQYDLTTVYGVDKRETTNPTVALRYALNGTSRWTAGTVTVSNTETIAHQEASAWECLAEIVKIFGGEIDSNITVTNDKIVRRAVCLYEQMGNLEATRRFDWGKDTTSVRRIQPEGARVCRVKFLGKEQRQSTGVGERITISSVNGGVDYLRDTTAEEAFKVPDGSGGWEYPMTLVENNDMETPSALKSWGQKVLHDYTRPSPTYEATVLQYAEAGVDMQGVSLGDVVHVVDKGFNPDVSLRIEARVIKIVTNELDPSDSDITIGQAGASFSKRVHELNTKMEAAQSKLEAMWNDNSNAPTTAAYLNWLLGKINSEVNATGGWTYITQGHGLRTYDTEVSDPLVGTEASQVVEIKGGNIRIANSRTSGGNWDWKTVIQSGHIAAELVTASQITTGFIGSPGSDYWVLGNNGHLETYESVFHNVTATGQFTCGGTTYFTRLTTDGKLAGYDEGVRVGYIDYTARVRDEITGVLHKGVQIQGGIMRISTPIISVLNSANTSQTTTDAFTGTIRQYVVTGVVDGQGAGEYFELEFINGLLVGYRTVARP